MCSGNHVLILTEIIVSGLIVEYYLFTMSKNITALIRYLEQENKICFLRDVKNKIIYDKVETNFEII
ncbi:MAG: hypothetical protein C0595_15125 [Marinilabiliales bacterium]|nr:MAG: hypothetical protein C0595_15125 [Marinilabiliales bacterium]